jgi:hypothetical protein
VGSARAAGGQDFFWQDCGLLLDSRPHRLIGEWLCIGVVCFCVTFKENANCAHATFRHAPHSQLDGHASNSHSHSHTHSLRNAHTYLSSRGPSSRQRLRRNEGVRISPCAEGTVCCMAHATQQFITSHSHVRSVSRAQLIDNSCCVLTASVRRASQWQGGAS